MSAEIIKVLITGANGLLGKYLIETLEQNKIQYRAYNKNELDITDIYSVSTVLHVESPSHIFNCAAYTNVVKAEVDREICYKLNVDGVKNLTSVCNQLGSELIQFSTDFVFDGTTKDGLYKIDDKKNPLNYYGYTKSLAEDHIINYSQKWKIVRTSWLFGNSDNNFVHKIIKQSLDGRTIQITNQEVGVPTYAKDLALRLLEIISYANGIYHITNSGIASRFDYASLVLALTTRGSIQISNINKKEVERPKRVILVNNLDKDLRNWEEALEAYLSSENI